MKVFQTRRQISVKDKLNILYCTYGSLTNFRVKQYGSSDVARQTKLQQPTVFKALRRFEGYGHNVSEFLKIRSSPGRKIKVIGSEVLERKLLDPITLTKWAHLTIAQRAVKIFRQFKVRVTPEKLRFFYRRNKLRYRQTALKYFPHGRNLLQLEQERVEFAQMLSNHIANDRQILYMDETTFNCEQIQSKAWYFQQVTPLSNAFMFRNQKFIVPAPKTRGKGWTVYGAIGTCLRYRNSYFDIGISTNMKDFKVFIVNLGKQIKAQYRDPKPILVIDNHSAHKGKDRMAIMEKYFQVNFIPAYSCELNQPIETTWSVLKRRVKTKFTELLIKKKLTRDKSIEIVKKEFKLIDPSIFANIMRSHQPYLQSLL